MGSISSVSVAGEDEYDEIVVEYKKHGDTLVRLYAMEGIRQSGSPNKATVALSQAMNFNAFEDESKTVYVGAASSFSTSTSSVTTALQHQHELYVDDHGFNDLFVIYDTTSRKDIKEAEAQVVDALKADGRRVKNLVPSSSGLRRGHDKVVHHFLYVAIKTLPRPA